MDLDQALEIVNDPSLNAYCDYVHEKLYREYGEYELGIDAMYDQIVAAFAFVSVEIALSEELSYVPAEEGAPDDIANGI